MKGFVVGVGLISLIAMAGCETTGSQVRNRHSVSLGASVSSRGDLTFTVFIAPAGDGESRKAEPPKPATAAAPETKSAPVALNINTSVNPTPKKAGVEPAKNASPEKPASTHSPAATPGHAGRRDEMKQIPKETVIRAHVRVHRS
ncbi:MAG: hypothetical protein U0136_19115 [Bdellovibrionota bacterium]